MTKKLLYLCLVLLLALSCKNEEGTVCISTEDQLSHKVWRGEKKSIQLSIQTEIELTDLKLTVSDFKGKSGIIPASALSANFLSEVIGDVMDTTAFSQCGERPEGKYESIRVADIIDNIQSKNLAAGAQQQLWLTIKVPRDTKPGAYKGFIEAASKERTVKQSFDFIVTDEILPEPADWKFHLDLWQNPYSVARFHNLELWSEEHFEAMRPVMKMLADAGQKVVTATIMDRPWNGQTEDPFGSMVKKTMYKDGRWDYDFSVFDKWVEFMFSLGIDKQINCFSMIPWGLTFDYIDGESGNKVTFTANPEDKEYRDYWKPFMKAFAAHLKEKQWFGKTMIAMDEREMKDMLSAIAIIREADPEFKVSLAGSYHPELAYELSDYCIGLQDAFPEDVMRARKARGLVSTVYTCCAEAVPNTFIYSNPAEAVWLGWFALANNYDGYLRWAYNSWTINPLEDARFRTWAAGDCYIVYPDGRSSVRFERLIEGIQDYEKARILQERWAGDEKQSAKLQEALAEFTLQNLKEKGPEKALEKAKSIIN